TIITMETFQKIYRPEIDNANSAAGQRYQPSLDHADYAATGIVYDREERARLGAEQGRIAEEQPITPHRDTREQCSARYAHHDHAPQDVTLLRPCCPPRLAAACPDPRGWRSRRPSGRRGSWMMESWQRGSGMLCASPWPSSRPRASTS